MSAAAVVATKPQEEEEFRPYEDLARLSVKELQLEYGLGKKNGLQCDGLNHVAFVCKDMAKTVWFWCEVLGMRLLKTIELPNEGQHFFIEGGRGASIAYFYFKDAPPAMPGVSSVAFDEMVQTGKFATAHGSVNHTAFNVPVGKLREYRKRVLKAGLGLCSPILFHSDVDPTGYSKSKDEHTMWQSFYFEGPDGEYLEFTAQSERELTPEQDIKHRPFTLAKL